MDDHVQLILIAITCNQQRSIVGPVTQIVLQPSNGWLH